MSYNFPNSPSQGQTFTPAGGYQYVYSGGVWRIVESPQMLVTAEARSRIVNGAMQISQENTIGTAQGSDVYVADQWPQSFTPAGTAVVTNLVVSGIYGATRNVFRFSSGATPVGTVAATDLFYNFQRIEGIRLKDFGWGTASALPAVVRFTTWGHPGTYTLHLRQPSASHSWVKTFTVGNGIVENWSFAVPGPTVGTWPIDTSAGLDIGFTVVCGSTYLTSTQGAWISGNFVGVTGMSNIRAVANQYLEISNVGLYLDPQNTGIAPPWQMPDEAQELAACMRYYEKIGHVVTNTSQYSSGHWMALKRIAPAISTVFDVGSGGSFTGVSAPNSLSTYYQNINHSGVGTGTLTGNARM